MNAKLYSLGTGRMVEIDTKANEGLPVGTLLQWNGYGDDICVITSSHKSDFDGSTYYEYVNTDSAKFGRIEGWGLKPISEKKDNSIAVYILPEVMPADEVLALYEKAKALKDLEQAKSDAYAKSRAEEIEKGRKIAAEKIPADTEALIVAAHDVDASDSQTDYFHHQTTQIIVLAASKHKRDLFAEMRKAAATLPQTAHMGPGKGRFNVYAVANADCGCGVWKGCGSHWHDEVKKSFDTKEAAETYIKNSPAPGSIEFQGVGLVTFSFHLSEEKIEHREKYSMGAGYYLKDGWDNSTGWRVYKVRKGADWGAEIYLSLGQVCNL